MISAGFRLSWVLVVLVIKEVRTEIKRPTYARFNDKQLIYSEGSKK